MRELAAATGDPEAIERLKDVELELEELGKTADVVGREMRESLRDSGEEALSSLIDGTRKAKDAFQDFISDIKRRFADLISERFFDKIFMRSGGGGGGGNGGFGEFLAGVFHTGGIAGMAKQFRRIPPIEFAGAPYVHNGGLLPDEVPAILQRGEEVLTRTDPRHRDNFGNGVTVNIATPNVQQFGRSRGQIAADVATALLRARNRYK
jgi:hypothetical protein